MKSSRISFSGKFHRGLNDRIRPRSGRNEFNERKLRGDRASRLQDLRPEIAAGRTDKLPVERIARDVTEFSPFTQLGRHS